MKRQINTTNALSPEDKKYLRGLSNYLNSMGMVDGSIEIDLESGYSNIEDIDWDNITHFSNNYRAEIPDGLTVILKKIMNYVDENDLFSDPAISDINYERLDIDIDTERHEISVNHWWSYYDTGEENSVEWDDEEGKDLFEGWEKDGVFEDLEVPDNGILILSYNGSGDSGFVESSFDENFESVPSAIEDWCYDQLESHFGGWEINEGSDGSFLFDFNNLVVTLSHTYNTEEHESDTLYEESFDK
jgi:hypothetical protein